MSCDANDGRLVAPGGVIYDDGVWRVEHSLSPVLLKGWLIVKPRRHVEHVADLNEAETKALGPLLARVSDAIRASLGAARVYVCSFGELVHHVHFYLVPRYAGMPASGIEVLSRMFSDERPWACSDDAAAEAARAMRERLIPREAD